MSKDFENILIEEFSQFDFKNFSVDRSQRILFICGGTVDATEKIPPSFRDRLFTYTAKAESEMHDQFILAETFKDYFKDNIYTDLLAFEEDIAHISSLVIIFLESPGSLVELGMFCNKPQFYKKLVIVAPSEEIKEEDSFIYLGPLEYIRKKDPSSVAIFPWPDKSKAKYDEANLKEVCDVINTKLSKLNNLEEFKEDNPAHLALLICDIITICYPILISDIELTLAAIGIDLKVSVIRRYLYLLAKVKLISRFSYSTTYQFYVPVNKTQSKIKFGKAKNKQNVDVSRIKMSILETLINSKEKDSTRILNARKQIVRESSK